MVKILCIRCEYHTSKDSLDTESTRKCYGQTDGRTRIKPICPLNYLEFHGRVAKTVSFGEKSALFIPFGERNSSLWKGMTEEEFRVASKSFTIR